jgi:hypothetical protein
MPRNSSTVSLPDQERPSSPFSVSPKAILLQRKPHTGRAEFLGLTLPVDINMIFEVRNIININTLFLLSFKVKIKVCIGYMSKQ